MIECPKCGGDAGVYNGFADLEELRYVRRRKCKLCDYKFITVEVISDTGIQGAGTHGGSRAQSSPATPKGGEQLFFKRRKEETVRPCETDGGKAYFHGWVQQENVIIVAEHFMKQEDLQRISDLSHKSGIIPKGFKLQTVQHTFALVEYLDGTVEKVNPETVRFTDR